MKRQNILPLKILGILYNWNKKSLSITEANDVIGPYTRQHKENGNDLKSPNWSKEK